MSTCSSCESDLRLNYINVPHNRIVREFVSGLYEASSIWTNHGFPLFEPMRLPLYMTLNQVKRIAPLQPTLSPSL